MVNEQIWNQCYTSIVIVINVLVVLYLLFKNDNSEGFIINTNQGEASSPDSGFDTYADGEASTYVDNQYGIIYGVDNGSGIVIPPTTMKNLTQNGAKQFACWPGVSFGSSYNGLPALPVNDPAPNVPKKCYVPKNGATQINFNAQRTVTQGPPPPPPLPAPAPVPAPVIQRPSGNLTTVQLNRSLLNARYADANQKCNMYESSKTPDNLRSCIDAQSSLMTEIERAPLNALSQTLRQLNNYVPLQQQQ